MFSIVAMLACSVISKKNSCFHFFSTNHPAWKNVYLQLYVIQDLLRSKNQTDITTILFIVVMLFYNANFHQFKKGSVKITFFYVLPDQIYLFYTNINIQSKNGLYNSIFSIRLGYIFYKFLTS